MADAKMKISNKLIMIACLIFDIAVIAAFVVSFKWFTVLEPDKSTVMLLVLIVGLILGNAAVAFPNVLFKMMGIAYSTYIIFLIVLYAVASNVLSIVFISGSLTWYIIWELFTLAIFVGALAIASFFSKGITEQIHADQRERATTGLLHVHLVEIENELIAQQHHADMTSVISAFAKLKERIQASTPFTRISDNSLVTEIENKVGQKLATLQSMIGINFTENSEADILQLIEETRRMIMQREQLMIK